MGEKGEKIATAQLSTASKRRGDLLFAHILHKVILGFLQLYLMERCA